MNQKTQFHFLWIVLLGTFVLAWFIFQPFIYALVLAAVFASVFQPLNQKILAGLGGRKSLSALLTIFVVTLVIFTPLVFLSLQIFDEASHIYISISSASGINSLNGESGLIGYLEKQIGMLQSWFPVLQGGFVDIGGYSKDVASWIIQHLGSLFSGFAKMAVSSFIFLMALFYFLRDGASFKNTIKIISPLEDSDDEVIIQKLKRAVDSVLKGSLIVALIQGALTSIGFMFFGIQNAVLWGGVATIAALIPGIGTALVIFPAVIFLFISGSLYSALGLLAWGVVIVGLVDNIVRPHLFGLGTEVHPLLVLLSVLGGISFFGPVGFILGPLTVSLLLAFFDTYTYLSKKQSKLGY